MPRNEATIEVVRLRHNLHVCGVRLRGFSHFEWQKLNSEHYISRSPFAVFSLEVSRFVKLVQYNSYLTTVVEALNMQVSDFSCF